MLLVEDDADLRAYWCRHSAQERQLLEFARGEDALRLARSETPDVIVSGVLLSGMDGCALVRALKSDPTTAFIPIGLLNGKIGNESRIEALESGADDYLSQPFHPTELVLRIRNLLRARARLQAHWNAHAREPTPPRTARIEATRDAVFATRFQEALDEESRNPAFGVTALVRQRLDCGPGRRSSSRLGGLGVCGARADRSPKARGRAVARALAGAGAGGQEAN